MTAESYRCTVPQRGAVDSGHKYVKPKVGNQKTVDVTVFWVRIKRPKDQKAVDPKDGFTTC